MNATALSPDVKAVSWRRSTEAVNAWRGQALHCFASAESAVSETLLTLSDVPEQGSKVRLRRLVGQRFEDLTRAISAEGPFGSDGERATLALATFLQHERLRPVLCHGTAKVAIDREGDWIAVFKLLAFRRRQAERTVVTFEQREAEELLVELRNHTQQLGSALQSLRACIANK